jgi:hypothetical protein
MRGVIGFRALLRNAVEGRMGFCREELMALSDLEKEIIQAFHEAGWTFAKAMSHVKCNDNDVGEALVYWYSLEARTGEYLPADVVKLAPAQEPIKEPDDFDYDNWEPMKPIS